MTVASVAVVNALAVDLEDYFQVSAFERVVAFDQWPAMEGRLEASAERLLLLFAEFRVRATFFVLGWNARRLPGLVRRIADEGHEIASHSFAHRLVYRMTPREFRDDLRCARSAIEDVTGRRVTGYRAPSYSITADSLWALDILGEEEYTFDSSVFPIRHDRYGIPGAARHPYAVPAGGGTLWEVPPTTIRLCGMNLPAAAGGYLRLLPFWWTRMAMRRLNRSEGSSAIVSTHPWELDPGQPRFDVDPVTRLRHYGRLNRTETLLRRLLGEFQFTTVSDVLAGFPPPATLEGLTSLAS